MEEQRLAIEAILKQNMTRQECMVTIQNLASAYIPELSDIIDCKQHSKYHKYGLLEHTADVVIQSRATDKDREDIVLTWSALLHDIGKLQCETTGNDGYSHYYGHPDVSAELAVGILKRLGYENDDIGYVKQIIENHDYTPYSSKKKTKLRRFIGDMGEIQLCRWFKLKQADILSHTNATEHMILYEEMLKVAEEIRQDGTALTIKELKINKSDLIDLGITQSSMAVDVLEALRTDCLGAPKLNNREWLINNALAKYRHILKIR